MTVTTAPPAQPEPTTATTRVENSSSPRVVVKSADMPEEIQRKAIELALAAIDRFELERDMAQYMKKEFDSKYQASWHCIVGRHFGSYVTHETNGFLYFYVGSLAVLLFRSG